MANMTSGRVYIRQPFAASVVSGTKRIETAHMRLPARFALTWLDVQTEQRELVGRVMFNGCTQWHTADAFDTDYVRHHVAPGSPFHFNNRRSTFGWWVYAFEPYAEPKPMPPMRSQFRLELY